MITREDVIKALQSKRLTGEEAGRIMLQDNWLVDHQEEGLLSKKDMRSLKACIRTTRDIEVYNGYIETYRLIDFTLKEANIMALEIQRDILSLTNFFAEICLDKVRPKLAGEVSRAYLVEQERILASYVPDPDVPEPPDSPPDRVYTQIELDELQASLEYEKHKMVTFAKRRILSQTGSIKNRLKQLLGYQTIIQAVSTVVGVAFSEDIDRWIQEIHKAVNIHNAFIEAYRPKTPEAEVYLTIDINNLKPAKAYERYIQERMDISLGEGWREGSEALFKESEEHA